MSLATSTTTVGEMVAEHEAALAAATARRDWDAVTAEARHLKALDRLALMFGPGARYQEALIGRQVSR